MGEYAPPATRHGFYHCNGIFWPDVGNSYRHERAKVSTIESLLRPSKPPLTKSGKPSKRNIPPPPPDPVGHWYEAQLLHYGLKPTKDKQAAKNRLQKALEEEKLVLPDFFATLEVDLKKEWNTANKQAEARLKREKRENEIRSGSKVEIAKREYEKALKEQKEITKAEKSATGGSSPTKKKPAAKKVIPTQKESAKCAPAKKVGVEKGPVKETQKKLSTKREPAKKEPGHKSPVKREAVKKEPIKAATKRSYSEFAEGAETSGQQGGSASVRPRQTARRSTYSNFANRPRPSTAQSIASPAKRENSPSDYEYGDPMDIDGDDYVSAFPGYWPDDRPDQHSPKSNYDTHEVDEDEELVVNGVYDIDAPEVTDEWGETDLKLILRLDRGILWGAYDLQTFNGIFRAQPGPTKVSRNPINFLWRGRETGEGEMSFGDCCTGHIAFLGDGLIEGEISVYGHMPFTGRRRPGPKTITPRSTADMKREWDGYNRQEYERERVGRWH